MTEGHLSWWKIEMKHFSPPCQSTISQMKSNNSVLGWLACLGCKQKTSNFHGKVFSFLLIVYFETSSLLFYICLLFSLWIKTNVRSTAFWAVWHMQVFLGSCISPMGSEQNGPKTFLFQQSPRRDREQRWLEDSRVVTASGEEYRHRVSQYTSHPSPCQ